MTVGAIASFIVSFLQVAALIIHAVIQSLAPVVSNPI